ncbi:MAG: MBL fold metallo-hydrolase [Bacteroidales bacterium]|nr:MBL fold metallo-hydrolase [Bacteroidales bacterium]
MNELLVKAIDASLTFEAIMDSIDFNSYLPENDENPKVKDTPEYKNYKKLLDKAKKCCNNAVGYLDSALVEKIKDIEVNDNSFFVPNKDNEKEVSQTLIYHLYEAKKTRVKACCQVKREDEVNDYTDSIHRLHKSLDYIPIKNFLTPSQGPSLANNYDWAKVLYYNELAICYSGLAKSSMSLGYAEESISLLEKIKNSDKDENQRILKLRSFAWCNKGEAERNLHDYDKAMLTFKKVIDQWEREKDKSSDYYQALFSRGLILDYQGRGKETLELLSKMDVPEKDTRCGARDLEQASAYIDQKEYKEARKILDGFQDEKKWDHTFAFRKASLYRIRCLLEWRKNKPTEFESDDNREWREEYEMIPKEIRGHNEQKIDGIIKRCIDRKDKDNFKKACKYFSEFYEQNAKIENKKKAKELQLWGYFMYLLYEEMENICTVENWEAIKKKLLSDFKILDKEEDTEYMQDFFDSYIDYLKCNKKDDHDGTVSYINYLKCNKKDDHDGTVIEKLYNRLKILYQENDNLSKLGKVEEKFRLFKDDSGKSDAEGKEKKESKDKNENGAVEFVQKCFFQGEPFKDDKKSVLLNADSILAKMEQNTLDFAEKIVRKTRRFPLDEKFRTILTVLRRWNSFTPALASSVNPSKGGGYFLYFQYKNNSYGIVIDPGYDFLDNFFSQGFRIGDIDTVIVSHAHPDHTDNLPSILSLFHESNGRLGKYYYSKKLNKQQFNKKHLKLIISHGVFDQYYKLIKPSEESLKDIIVVQPGNEGANEPCLVQKFDDNYSIEIKPFATSHKDLGQWESLGFIINIKKNKETIRTIGYTSDAHWRQDFSDNFKDCHIICAHLGSIVDILNKKEFCSLCGDYRDNGDGKCEKDPECKEKRFVNGNPTTKKLLKQAQEQNHLYLSGLTMFFDKLLANEENGDKKMELAVISEFGEELKEGLRMDLFHKFDDWFQERSTRSTKKAKCFPGDIGLEIDLLNSNILCCCCQEFKSKDGILPIPYGKDEAIFYICDECKSVLSPYQIEKKLKDYYENGRHLELAELITDGQVR